MKSKILIGFIVAIIVSLGAGGLVFAMMVRSLAAHQTKPEFHEHADFALFLNGKRFDFSQDKYMSTKPCTIDHSAAHDEDDVVHLHDLDGGVIHVHREGITYNDFFASLKMSFNDTAFTDDEGHTFANNEKNSFRFFLNGKEVSSIASHEIRDLDRVLITYGQRDRSQDSINAELGQVSNEACVSSHLCDHRGPVAEESCGAQTPQPNAWLQWLGVQPTIEEDA